MSFDSDNTMETNNVPEDHDEESDDDVGSPPGTSNHQVVQGQEVIVSQGEHPNNNADVIMGQDPSVIQVNSVSYRDGLSAEIFRMLTAQQEQVGARTASVPQRPWNLMTQSTQIGMTSSPSRAPYFAVPPPVMQWRQQMHQFMQPPPPMVSPLPFSPLINTPHPTIQTYSVLIFPDRRLSVSDPRNLFNPSNMLVYENNVFYLDRLYSFPPNDQCASCNHILAWNCRFQPCCGNPEHNNPGRRGNNGNP